MANTKCTRSIEVHINEIKAYLEEEGYTVKTARDRESQSDYIIRLKAKDGNVLTSNQIEDKVSEITKHILQCEMCYFGKVYFRKAANCIKVDGGVYEVEVWEA